MPTPKNYLAAPGGKDLPPTLKVWRVQNSGKETNGVVSSGEGYSDSPDAEVLAPGLNTHQKYGDVGIGRHANFLQWGFASPPSQMTDAGRALFLNCICYVRKFDGAAPLVHRVLRARTSAMKVDNLELVYYDKVYRVDDDLKSLGIASNRTVAALGQIIGLLKDDKTADKARLLLKRYTEETFQTPDQWQAWFDANRDRIYFSDVGGYKFRVVPKGYPLPERP